MHSFGHSACKVLDGNKHLNDEYGVEAKDVWVLVHKISFLFKNLNQVVTGDSNSFLTCMAKSTLRQSHAIGLFVISIWTSWPLLAWIGFKWSKADV